MSNTFSSSDGEPRRTWRRGSLVASMAVVAVAAAACGGGGGTSNSSGNNGGNNGGGNGGTTASSSAAPASSSGCDKDTDPYGNIKAAQAPTVTAKNVKLPQGTPGQGKPAVKIGSKNFKESKLVARLYGQALKAKGYQVQYGLGIGGSESIDQSFKSNQIDMYPEYLGEIASSLAGNPPAKNATQTYKEAKKFEKSERDATIFKQTPYEDVDILFVKPEFCKKYNLSTIGSLKHVTKQGGTIKYTAQESARTRFQGYKGLKKAYGLTKAKFVPTAPGGVTLQVVQSGKANVGDAFSTTSTFVQQVDNGTYVTLNDPKHIMGFQHVAPIVKQSVAQKEGKPFKQTLNWVDSLLTPKSIKVLDKATQIQRKDVATIAKKFLEANGLK